MTSLIGEAAAQFELAGPHGAMVSNATLAGAGALLLFVPSAFTPVCTQEVREHATLPGLQEAAALVVVSCDSAHTLTAWLDHLEVSCAVGSDFWPHGQVARAFGAFDERTGWPRRRSVLLNSAGTVVWTDQSAPGQARDPFAALQAIRRFEVA